MPLALRGEVSPYAAIFLIAPYGPRGAMRKIRRYPLSGEPNFSRLQKTCPRNGLPWCIRLPYLAEIGRRGVRIVR